MRFCFWGFFSLFPETVYVHSHLILLDLWGPFIPALPALPPSLLLDTFVSLGHDVTLCSPVSPTALLEDPFPVLFYLSISKYQVTPGQ